MCPKYFLPAGTCHHSAADYCSMKIRVSETLKGDSGTHSLTMGKISIVACQTLFLVKLTSQFRNSAKTSATMATSRASPRQSHLRTLISGCHILHHHK